MEYNIKEFNSLVEQLKTIHKPLGLRSIGCFNWEFIERPTGRNKKVYRSNNENPDCSLKQVKKLDPKIPGDLRLKIYSFFNQNYSIGHLIDIDHFVPKSAGGPGNIIENLVPIGLSLNRYKSDSIPRSFFEVALNDDFKTNFKVFEKEILKLLKNNEKFIRKKDYPNSIDLAREMNAVVSEWKKMDEIKNFYFEVNKKFNPEYVELIHKVK